MSSYADPIYGVVWERGASPFGTVPRCWVEQRHDRREICLGSTEALCGEWWTERARLDPDAHEDCDDPHSHPAHTWGGVPPTWAYCHGHGHCPPSPGVDRWITDTAYAPDDFVFGDAGLTARQLPVLHELLDLVRPGWRELFRPRGGTHGSTPHGHPCCGACPVAPTPASLARCGGPALCGGCRESVLAIHLGGTP